MSTLLPKHSNNPSSSTVNTKRGRKVGKASVLSISLIILSALFILYNAHHPYGDDLFASWRTDRSVTTSASTTPPVIGAGSSAATTTTSSTTSSNNNSGASAAAARAQRMKMYKDRYKYTPPIPYVQHTQRDELCGTHPHFDTYFNMPKLGPRQDPQRSANDEDKIIYEMFFKDPNHPHEIGSVVEMGAFNGIQESNSRFFETCLGWNTLLVEGNPLLWEQVVENRPHAHRFSFAPSCSEEEEMANKTVPFDRYPMTNAGVHQGNVTTAYSVKQWYVDVPCGSLTKVLLDIFPNGHVSFFSLDVEGAEPLVVGNIDFNKVFIEVMMIESRNKFCRNDSCESKRQFRKVMLDAGYVLFYNNNREIVKKSDLFIHPLSKHLKTIREKTGMEGITKSEF